MWDMEILDKYVDLEKSCLLLLPKMFLIALYTF